MNHIVGTTSSATVLTAKDVSGSEPVPKLTSADEEKTFPNGIA